MNKIRVMIVEDSPTVREFLCDAIGSDPRMFVVAACESAEQALAQLSRASPNVISMDIHLPRMSGLEATRRIMETRPTPIVIVSQSVRADDVDSTMNALRAGAVSAIVKPTCRLNSQRADLAAHICRELVVMSQVKVVRQRFNNRCKSKVFPAPASRRIAAVAPTPVTGRMSMIGIVASTGGPRALETILASVGIELAIPIVLVQHMTTSFHAGFVSWLDRISPQPVSEASNGEQPLAGHVYVAPAEKHLLIRNGRFVLDRGQPVSGQCPSGTLLLRSMAEDLGEHAAGIVLTGMGDDGAEGLLAIRQAGGYTIAEDESTAVVNGMPEIARRLGAACTSLPLESIGVAIKRLATTVQGVCA
jgi:two-component system, chemotaxis family, protein-glutamate methylesterase/glutaminase